MPIEICPGMPAVLGIGDLTQHAHGMFLIEIEPQQDLLDRLLLVVGGENLQGLLIIQAVAMDL